MLVSHTLFQMIRSNVPESIPDEQIKRICAREKKSDGWEGTIHCTSVKVYRDNSYIKQMIDGKLEDQDRD